jgi:hypothetical protein
MSHKIYFCQYSDGVVRKKIPAEVVFGGAMSEADGAMVA